MTVQCCQCKKVRLHNYWDLPRQPLSDNVTHSYCPVCLALAKRSFNVERRQLAVAAGK